MMTMDGTVRLMRGSVILRPTNDARSPAISAPMRAADSGSMPARSMSSRRVVLATRPMHAAVKAMRGVELNMMEKPNTPTKLIRHLSRQVDTGSRPCGTNSLGVKPTIMATIQPVMVARNTMVPA